MKIKLLITLIASIQLCYGQQDKNKADIIDLAKLYHQFHFASNLPTDINDRLNAITNPGLTVAKEFIAELIKTNNQIASAQFLTKPDSATLKNLYIIRGVNHNMFEATARDNNLVLDSLQNENTDYNELLSCYYSIIFTSVANKNKPFDMSQYNFKLSDYNLQNDTEKGIFFLESMDFFGTLIWGYMNVPKPPNYKLALEYIEKYPTYNGLPYYQFTDLGIQDFKLTTDKRKPKESFKKYYLNKYISTLLYHSICLSQKKKNDSKRTEVMLTSILSNESYWDYFAEPVILKQIFKKVRE